MGGITIVSNSNLVNSPEEAVEYMKRKDQRKGDNYYIVIPVFKKDGVTEIDQFWVYNGAREQYPMPWRCLWNQLGMTF